ncbi:MAG: UbiH/UbiF/VisC/COQ6 family ubiquinone biosynthesis hydroxylase [Alphaproteobacteria bacterium]|nr:UbiH/UbiF/VisC/COQ6 family ubiquinone biosynthesis hydroxylase [Alphaproteobacteria bacterium]
MSRFDVIVVGGGLVGGVAARTFASAGLEVALVDRAPVETGQAFDGRTTAISYASVQVLRGVGLWPAVAADAEPMTDIRITDGDAPLFLHYDHCEVGSEPFGYIVENRLLRWAMVALLEDTPTVALFTPATAARSERDGGLARLILADGRHLQAPLIVAADGRRSPLRREAGIGAVTWAYGQQALVLTVGHEQPHGNVAHERFLSGGPFAILPMTDGPDGEHRSSIVWSERSALADALIALDDTRFLQELEWRFGDFLGALRLIGPRWRWPVGLVLAERFFAARLALVGDAACGIHPIAGQGFNLGIRGVAVLAECLVDAFRLGLDIGVPAVLADYQRRQRADSVLLAGVTDGLNRLFSNAIPPVQAARQLGLAAVGRLPGVKRTFMRRAMGVAARPPRLVHGEPL